MTELTDLSRILQLDAMDAGSIDFAQYLELLKEDRSIADTAPAVILRAIQKQGVVKIEEEPVKRRPYLEMIASRRIPAWKAFDHVRGSHITVQRIMTHLRAAANGGQQLKQALVLIGGPGSGKDFLADAIKAALEGEIVYVVDGCPVHENPINLLKFLSKEKQDELAKMLGLEKPEKGCPSLEQMLAVAGDPCNHCWTKVMCDDGEEHAPAACRQSGHRHNIEHAFRKEPNLSKVKVRKLRLTSRLFGIATWSQTADGCSLIDAIRQGSGGIVVLPEMCTVQKAKEGDVLQIDALIDATDKRIIPDLADCHGQSGYLPVNAVIMGLTNYGAWDNFIAGQSDPSKFIRRFNPISVPYITARVEEEGVYQTLVDGLRFKPDFDPNALMLAATLAVGSRLRKVEGLSPIDKVRILNGEDFIVRKQDPYGGGGYRDTWSPAPKPAAWSEKDLAEALKKAEGGSDRDREGMTGINLPFMLAFVSNLAQAAMQAPKDPEFPNDPPSITAIGMIDALRQRLEAHKQTPRLPDEEKRVLDTCLTEWLKKPATIDEAPGYLEQEYRRILRQEILDAFEPAYEERAQDIFNRYRMHANAYGQNLSKFRLPGTSKELEVDTTLLNDIDHGRSLKPETLKDALAYRGSIEAQINNLKFSRGTLPSEDADKTIDWTSLPELKQAIEDYLNAEIARKVERILGMKPDLLDKDDKAAYEAAFAKFASNGYSPKCFKRALEYAKELKLWAKRQD